MSMNPLALGFYSVPEAARLIEVGSRQRIYGWLRGYRGRASGPLIQREFQPLDGHEEISFLDLMELRLVEILRHEKVKPRTIRLAIVEARRLFGSDKPFATDKIFLKTDGKGIFVEEILKKIAKEEKDSRLWNLITKQYEHYELIERSLVVGVTFDPESRLARTWQPRRKQFPRIIIDPRIAYGKPITPSHVPTDTLHSIYQAENDVRAAADYFQIAPEEAEMGIRFQELLLGSDTKLAA